MDRQRREQQAIELARLRDPIRELLDKEAVKSAAPHVKRQDILDDSDGIDSEGQGSSTLSTSPALPNEHGRQSGPANASGNGDGRTPVVEAKVPIEPAPHLKAVTGVPGGGMIWIDISSWQTAGCWVPGGVHGRCPYQDPDNTVALQEIIKVSTIGMGFFARPFALDRYVGPASCIGCDPLSHSHSLSPFSRWCHHAGAGWNVPVPQVSQERTP